jgi:hypothetical protein
LDSDVKLKAEVEVTGEGPDFVRRDGFPGRMPGFSHPEGGDAGDTPRGFSTLTPSFLTSAFFFVYPYVMQEKREIEPVLK